MSFGVRAAESGWAPDWSIRLGIRALLRARLRDERAGSTETARRRHLAAMAQGPIAVSTDAANVQHYAVPAAFFRQVLGPRMKYSCCRWEGGASTLADAEESMIRMTAERAGVDDGMRILDLGCGWGSWALWAARTLPRATLVAVSNSVSQRQYIEQRAAAEGLQNLTVVTADMNTFKPEGTFDRIVSVEMFEHMRNYDRLLSRIRAWLRPGGKLFVHIFCHRQSSYFFDDAGPGDWMARNFFTGGIMPAADLLRAFPSRMQVDGYWPVDGREYQRTAAAWLRNLDARRPAAEAALATGRDLQSARRDVNRWRLFFLACSELFGYRGGSEWFVSHYLLSPPSETG